MGILIGVAVPVVKVEFEFDVEEEEDNSWKNDSISFMYEAEVSSVL